MTTLCFRTREKGSCEDHRAQARLPDEAPSILNVCPRCENPIAIGSEQLLRVLRDGPTGMVHIAVKAGALGFEAVPFVPAPLGHKHRAEAELREIANLKRKVAESMAELRTRRHTLLKIAVEAFNEESAPIDGQTVEESEIILGDKPCAKGPIGVCVYSDQVVSLPGQRGLVEKRDDACLFCGEVMSDQDSGL